MIFCQIFLTFFATLSNWVDKYFNTNIMNIEIDDMNPDQEGKKENNVAANYNLPQDLVDSIASMIGAEVKNVTLENGKRLVIYLSEPTKLGRSDILPKVREIAQLIKNQLRLNLSDEHGYVADASNGLYMLRFNQH